jgi:hypothetical protein
MSSISQTEPKLSNSTKFKSLLFVLCILTLLAVAVVAALNPWMFSTRAMVQRWLSMKLPAEATEIRYWYQQPKGYYQADLVCRIQLPFGSFTNWMQEVGIPKVDGPKWILPTNFNSDKSVTWWNPPSNQPNRFHQEQQQDTWITLVWSDGFVYIERFGNFGAWLGPHSTMHN